MNILLGDHGELKWLDLIKTPGYYNLSIKQIQVFKIEVWRWSMISENSRTKCKKGCIKRNIQTEKEYAHFKPFNNNRTRCFGKSVIKQLELSQEPFIFVKY